MFTRLARCRLDPPQRPPTRRAEITAITQTRHDCQRSSNKRWAEIQRRTAASETVSGVAALSARVAGDAAADHPRDVFPRADFSGDFHPASREIKQGRRPT